jgi:hypothetical protein
MDIIKPAEIDKILNGLELQTGALLAVQLEQKNLSCPCLTIIIIM